jgi:hypothetical protein
MSSECSNDREAHEWHNADGQVERCYHCRAEQPLRPEWRDSWTEAMIAAELLELEDPQFHAWVTEAMMDQGYERFSEKGEVLVVTLWLAQRLGSDEPPERRRD